MKPYPYTYSRLPFAIAGWIMATVWLWIAVGQLIDRSPIAAGVFVFFSLMSLGLGEMMAGRRPRHPTS
jgi:hypothetical protein